MASCRVQPCEHVTSPSIIRLSVADASAPKSWTTQVLFWRLLSRAKLDQAHRHLKEGLSRFLADLPHLAGKLANGPTGHPLDLTVEVPDDASVQLDYVDASTNSDIPSLPLLVHSGLPLPAALKAAITPRLILEPVVDGSPVFCAQVTRLAGGVALSLSCSHVVSDGVSSSWLEWIWAMYTLDVSQGIPYRRQKTATADEQIRHRLSTIDEAIQPEMDPVFGVVSASEARSHLPKDARSAKEASDRAAAVMMSHVTAQGEKPEPRGFAMWQFTPSRLAALRTAASSMESNQVSTMDALGALFWSRIAHILGRSANGYETSRCVFPINIRQRIQPPVPDHYIGNAYLPTMATCSLATLESDNAGLRAAASSLRQANNEWTASRWDACLSKIISLPTDQALAVDRNTVLQKHNFSFNDYSRFQSNTLSWGAPLGQPIRTRYLKRASPIGAHSAHVYAKLPDGSVEVSLLCGQVLRQALQADPIFMKYADFLCYDP